MSTVQLGSNIVDSLTKWQRIAITDPARVVRTIDAPLGDESSEDITALDVYTALITVAQISARKNDPKGGVALWDALIQAGVADQLCKTAENMNLNIMSDDVAESSPRQLAEAMRIDLSTPYQFPLEILQNLLSTQQKPPTTSDKKALSAIKQHWLAITQRVWDEPANSLLPSDSHVNSRMIYAQICTALTNADQYALLSIYDPDGKTLSVVARFWRHSTSKSDTLTNTRALEWLLHPDHPDHASYIRDHGAPSSEYLLTQLYTGASPKPTSGISIQAAAVVSVAAKHIVQDPDIALHSLNLLLRICFLASQSNDIVFYSALRSSGALWSSCISILRRPASDAPDAKTQALIDFTMGLMVNVTHNAHHTAPAEREALVKLWAEQGLFDALDKNIEYIAVIPGAYKHIAHLSVAIGEAVKDSSDALKSRILMQFPRWRTIGTLIRHDVKSQEDGADAPDPPPDGEMAPPEHPMWRHASWQCFADMENLCFDWDICGRRTCGKPGELWCKGCAEVKYCSETCSERDKAAHKMVCVYMPLVKRKVGPQMVPPTPTSQTIDSLS